MHPLVRILYFIFVLLLISTAGSTVLLFMLLFFLTTLTLCKIKSFLHALRRMRWLFLSILLIYAFGTPGELVPQFPVGFAPTYEGLHLGVLQIEKLVIALAALSLLLTSSSKEQMMLGLYMLLTLLKFLGLNIERFTARLMLTLDYVEDLASRERSSVDFRHLDEIDEHLANLQDGNAVVFEKHAFKLIDKIMLFLLSLLFVFMAYRGFA